jgi:hypothetical protein
VPKGASKKRSDEYELGSAVVDAIASYDLFKVAELLKVSPDRPKSFGNTATRR